MFTVPLQLYDVIIMSDIRAVHEAAKPFPRSKQDETTVFTEDASVLSLEPGHHAQFSSNTLFTLRPSVNSF